MMQKELIQTLLLATGVMFLNGCGKQAAVEPPAPRPVVTHTVVDGRGERVRHFSGQLSAAEGAPLSFEVSGRGIAVSARAGTRYSTGAVLAEIDSADYVNQFNDAEAKNIKAEQEVRRMQLLFESRNASQSQLEAAVAQAASAGANYNLARKALESRKLTMPYDGVIGSVDVEAQQVISSGQTVMSIQGDNGLT